MSSVSVTVSKNTRGTSYVNRRGGGTFIRQRRLVRDASRQFSDVMLTNKQKEDARENEEKLYLRILRRKAKLQEPLASLTVLGHKTFILLVIAVTASIESCRTFLSSTDEEWGITYILPFTVAYFTFSVPLQMCQSFLGRYGHKSLITVWEISPIFYGLGITYVMIIVLVICRTVVKGSMALVYLSYSFHKQLSFDSCPPIMEQRYNNCYDSPQNENFTCDKHFVVYVGSYNYVYKALFYIVDPSDPENSAEHLSTCLAITWMCIFGVSALNLVKISKVLMFIIVVTIIGGAYGSINILRDGHFTGLKPFFFLDKNKLLDSKVWLGSIILANHVSATESGIHIVLGVMIGDKSPAHYDVVITALLSYFIILWFAIIGYALGGMISTLYNVPLTCISLKGWRFHFAMLPEFVRRSSMSHHMVNAAIYTTIHMFLVVFISILICVLSELMLQTFKRFQGYRRYTEATVCSFCFIVSTPFVTQAGNKVMPACSMAHHHLGYLVPALFCVAVFWIYGVRRILDDFHFTMGYELAKFWKYCWHVMAVFAPGCFFILFILYFDYGDEYLKNSYYLTFFMLLPVIVSVTVRIIMAMVKMKFAYLWYSSRTFGPESREEKIERRNFIPHLWMRHREKHLNCKHKCLVSSTIFEYAVHVNEMNRKLFNLSFSIDADATNFEGTKIDY